MQLTLPLAQPSDISAWRDRWPLFVFDVLWGGSPSPLLHSPGTRLAIALTPYAVARGDGELTHEMAPAGNFVSLLVQAASEIRKKIAASLKPNFVIDGKPYADQNLAAAVALVREVAAQVVAPSEAQVVVFAGAEQVWDASTMAYELEAGSQIDALGLIELYRSFCCSTPDSQNEVPVGAIVGPFHASD